MQIFIDADVRGGERVAQAAGAGEIFYVTVARREEHAGGSGTGRDREGRRLLIPTIYAYA